jgi:hypothetical protein
MLPLHRMPCERQLDEDGGKKEGEKAAKNSAEMGSVYLVTECCHGHMEHVCK